MDAISFKSDKKKLNHILHEVLTSKKDQNNDKQA